MQAGGRPQAVTAPTLAGLGAAARSGCPRTGCGRRSCSTGPGAAPSTWAPSSAPRTASVALRDFRAIAPELPRSSTWRGGTAAPAGAGRRPRTGSCPTPWAWTAGDWRTVPTAGLPGQPTVHRGGPGPAAAGQRRRDDLAAGRRDLGHPGPGSRAAGRDGAVLPPLTRPLRGSVVHRSAAHRPRGRSGQAVPWSAGIAALSGVLAELVLPRTCAGCGIPGSMLCRRCAARLAGPGRPRRGGFLGLPADGGRRRLRRTGPAGGARVQGAGSRGARPAAGGGARAGRRRCRVRRSRAGARWCWCPCPARRPRCGPVAGTTSGN